MQCLQRQYLIVIILVFLVSVPRASAQQVVVSGPVSSNGQVVNATLQPGATYALRVSGSVYFGRWSGDISRELWDDACFEFNARGYPSFLQIIEVIENGRQIYVCDGNYNPNHVYQSGAFVASGGSISVGIFDSEYLDNQGDLFVELLLLNTPDVGMDRTFFAQQVAQYTMGYPGCVEDASDPTSALGEPGRNGRTRSYVSLGCGGVLILDFGGTIWAHTVRVMEVGPASEGTRVDISADGYTWYTVGDVAGGTRNVNLGSPQQVQYVRLTDLQRDCGGNTPGADIDAVALIGPH